MSAVGWIQLVLYIAVLLAITKPLGIYLCKVLDPGQKTFLDFALKPVERLFYRIFGVDPLKEHNWKQYSVAMLMFSGVSAVFSYGIMRLQGFLPWHGLVEKLTNNTPITPHLAFNTAVSFTTNTNWQSYYGENTMSYFSQMVALASHNFWSAAVGIAIAAALVRGIARDKLKTIGNFWADLVRLHLYLLIPICIVYALFLVSQGIIDNFKPYTTVATGSINRRQAAARRSRRQLRRGRWLRRSPSRCWGPTAAGSSTPTPPIRLKTPRRSPTSCRSCRSSPFPAP